MTKRIEKLRWWGFGLWILVVVGYLATLHSYGSSPLQLALGALHWLKTDPRAPLVYVLMFVGRPILMLPASFLSVLAGHCFGAVGGEVWAMTGGGCAGALVYYIGALWGPRLTPAEGPPGRWQGFLEQLSRNGTEATAMMRIAFFPFEMVSFLCGSVRMPMFSFQLGTLLGSIPTTTSCVLFGAGIHGDFRGELPHIDWRYQGAAVIFLVLAIAMSQWVKRRHAHLAARPQE